MIHEYMQQFTAILNKTVVTDEGGKVMDHQETYDRLTRRILSLKSSGGIVYLVGNGGSSGIISHASIDFINACNIRAFPVTDNSILTCLANDYGYENVFSKALETMFTSNDLLICVSSSGKSKNILNAADLALSKKGTVITYSGFSENNPLRGKGNYNFWLETTNYGVAEIGHALLIHILTDGLMRHK